MKVLIKTFCLGIVVSLVVTSCRKTDLAPVSPVGISDSQYRTSFSISDSTNIDGENIFTDKNKCKKCHTGKSMSIDWNAPYMSDNSYKTIEELVANYDFVNNVHILSGERSRPDAGISEYQRQELIVYLKGLALNATQKSDR
jgi:hypothetical protein